MCIRHRRDAEIESFGHADRFHDACGADGSGYLDWLEPLLRTRGACALALIDDEVVGHVESRLLVQSDGAGVGRVHLYYVVPTWRRQGVGTALDGYVTAYYRDQDATSLRLMVGPDNGAARAFYGAQGWVDDGVDAQHPEVLRMRKII